MSFAELSIKQPTTSQESTVEFCAARDRGRAFNSISRPDVAVSLSYAEIFSH